jgi:hypothetical protein
MGYFGTCWGDHREGPVHSVVAELVARCHCVSGRLDISLRGFPLFPTNVEMVPSPPPPDLIYQNRARPL